MPNRKQETTITRISPTDETGAVAPAAQASRVDVRSESEPSRPAPSQPSRPAPSLPTPTFVNNAIVDHFRIMRLIGRGGMGEVYLARDTELSRKVALKLIHPELLGSEQAVERFMFEAKATARFNHPHIVTVYSVGQYLGRPYVALEYLSGDNLRQRLQEAVLSWQEAVRFGVAIAEALAEAHAHGILHRDLKPANVVIPSDGRLRVVDFGLAKQVDVPLSGPALSLKTGQLDGPETMQGVKGTPAYMAPEQWEGESSGKTDVWALGVMLYEMTTGQRPFPGDSPVSLAQAACCPEPVPRVDALSDLPKALADLIARCLEKYPLNRPSAAELAESLRRLLHEGRGTLSEVGNPFRGLLPFTEHHYRQFFGRDAEITAFVERMRERCVLPIIGPSGSGKSSFVRAGVLARLREQGRWVVLRMRPGARPFRVLANRLSEYECATEPTLAASSNSSEREPDSETPSSATPESQRELARTLEETPERLSAELRALSDVHDTHVLLFVDQLEELFTMGQSERVRRAFVKAICTAADDRLDPVRVVFTVRDDFLGRLAVGPEVRQVLRDITVLQSPEHEALKEILSAPVIAAGYRYENAELVAALVEAVKGEPAGLPLLQFAAHKLWELRDRKHKVLLRSAYERIGGVEGALAAHADGVLDGMPPAESALARHVLLRLVTAERTRKVAPREQVLEGLDSAAEQVLSRLVEARLVSVRKSRSETDEQPQALVELAHESLIERWRTLSRWLDESREQLAVLEETQQAAELWKKRGSQTEELWQGVRLGEALRALERCNTEVPPIVTRFLRAGADKQTRRLRRKRIVIAAAIAALSLVAVMLAVQNREIGFQRDRAEHREAEARQQRAEALQQGARAAFGQGNFLEARAKLRMALESDESQSARALWWQLNAQPLRWKKTLGTGVYGVAFSPDGKSIAAGCQDKAIYLLDVNTRRARVLRGSEDQVLTVTFAPNGLLASGGWDGEINLWDVEAATQRTLEGHTDGVWRLQFSPASRLLASASYDKTVRLWNVESGKQERLLQGHTGPVHDVSFSADGKLLVSGSADQTVRLWDVESGQTKRLFKGHTAPVRGVSFSPDGQQLASASNDQTVRLWDVETGSQKHLLDGHTGWVTDVDFSPDGRLIVSASNDETVRLWDVESGKPKRVFEGHTARVWGASFSPDGQQVASSGSIDKTVRLWDVKSERKRHVPSGHTGAVHGVSFSPDGQQLASASGDKTVRLWDVE